MAFVATVGVAAAAIMADEGDSLAKTAPGREVVVVIFWTGVVVLVAAGVVEALVTSVVGTGTFVLEEDAATAATATADTAVDDPAKLPEAVAITPAATATFLIMTSSPSVLVTLTSTDEVPKPEDFSK
jgi:hypothetical protein